jgi:hypothetical protein
MTKAGSKTMCQRELRNLQNVMLKAKLANKPQYLELTSKDEHLGIEKAKDSLF